MECNALTLSVFRIASNVFSKLDMVHAAVFFIRSEVCDDDFKNIVYIPR